MKSLSALLIGFVCLLSGCDPAPVTSSVPVPNRVSAQLTGLAASSGVLSPVFDSASVVFPFNSTVTQLPGKRIPGCANLYLVDSISIGNPGDGLVGTMLGFAPREGVDLDQDVKSRVILSNPHRLGTAFSYLAVTAAHELGNLLGLRHTVSTRHDLLPQDGGS